MPKFEQIKYDINLKYMLVFNRNKNSLSIMIEEKSG